MGVIFFNECYEGNSLANNNNINISDLFWEKYRRKNLPQYIMIHISTYLLSYFSNLDLSPKRYE